MVVALDEAQRARLAAAVRARQRELRLTQLQIADSGGISQAVVNRIVNARADSVAESTLDGLDLGLRWLPRQGEEMGSAERVIYGGSPLPADSPRPVTQEFVDDIGVVRRRIVIEGAKERREPLQPSELAQRIAEDPESGLIREVLGRLLSAEPAKKNNLLVGLARMLDAAGVD